MSTKMEVKAKLILMSGPMVLAILEGRKRMTRRVIKPPKWWKGMTHHATGTVDEHGRTMTNMVLCEATGTHWQYCPHGTPNSRLWVRETFATDGPMVRYYATDDVHELRKKKPSIFMPRWASRLTLRITEVRVERLQAISEADAEAEGVAASANYSARQQFARLWDSINHNRRGCSWDANPWTWAIGFSVEKGADHA